MDPRLAPPVVLTVAKSRLLIRPSPDTNFAKIIEQPIVCAADPQSAMHLCGHPGLAARETDPQLGQHLDSDR
jgi:hypothetical protein